MFEKKRGKKREREKRYRVRAYITISWSPNASSPNTFSTAIFPYFFLPVAMFVFAIANIKTARARRNAPPPFLPRSPLPRFPEQGGEGVLPISYGALEDTSPTDVAILMRNESQVFSRNGTVNERLSIRNWREFLFTIIAIIYFFLFRGNSWINTQGEFVLNLYIWRLYGV